jgi:hypothetical protein
MSAPPVEPRRAFRPVRRGPGRAAAAQGGGLMARTLRFPASQAASRSPLSELMERLASLPPSVTESLLGFLDVLQRPKPTPDVSPAERPSPAPE